MLAVPRKLRCQAVDGEGGMKWCAGLSAAGVCVLLCSGRLHTFFIVWDCLPAGEEESNPYTSLCHWS